jgi:uncharacterized protein YabN with tetrapyrrole methylase and pyrophosphatase domain
MSRKRTGVRRNIKGDKGSLIIVGVGIQAVRQITLETRHAIEYSEKVLYLVHSPIFEIWIKRLRPDAKSIINYYVEGKKRVQIYSEMVELTMKYVRQGFTTCLVLYGHPSVFTSGITKPALRKAQKEGFRTNVLPGISAEDCLFADLCVDPGDIGCQSFEANRFLRHKRKFDTNCHLIIWQIGAIGQFGFTPLKDPRPGLVKLTEYLKLHYDSKHEVIVYQAAQYAICEPFIERLPLHRLPEIIVDYITTLYVPPIDYKKKS